MSTAQPRTEAFIIDCVTEFEHTNVAKQDGRIRVDRALPVDDPEGTIRMDDVLDLAREHGLILDDVMADFELGRLYLFFDGEVIDG